MNKIIKLMFNSDDFQKHKYEMLDQLAFEGCHLIISFDDLNNTNTYVYMFYSRG